MVEGFSSEPNHIEMKKVLWASPHNMTEEQIKSLGDVEIIYLKDSLPKLHKRLCNMQIDSNRENLVYELAAHARRVLGTPEGELPLVYQPAGDPKFQYLVGMIDVFQPVYAFSKRISEDIEQPDGSIKKVSTFKHEGWI